MIEKGYEYKYPNGESLIDSYNRVCIELDNIISIMMIEQFLFVLWRNNKKYNNLFNIKQLKYHWNFKIDNGSVTILEVQDGFTVITAMNILALYNY